MHRNLMKPTTACYAHQMQPAHACSLSTMMMSKIDVETN